MKYASPTGYNSSGIDLSLDSYLWPGIAVAMLIVSFFVPIYKLDISYFDQNEVSYLTIIKYPWYDYIVPTVAVAVLIWGMYRGSERTLRIGTFISFYFVKDVFATQADTLARIDQLENSFGFGTHISRTPHVAFYLIFIATAILVVTAIFRWLKHRRRYY